ncbi:hypothetical protein HRK28_04560 [Rathayibacter sp. VKM Ac-2835]|uniref:hypothetical protein n=1 Tax=Rathayibacter sp. VKM Ac-2835 TaxID=2739043 RepID=UPI001563BF89|nr:hypothetical protein [Rathayibacter sp. VKM Ac-2835]NRG40186.1 hypothetical protein [Rathayibacter sp. VKM Ac-2835]
MTVANTIAEAIYADPSHERLAVLVVSSWTPDTSTGYLEQVDTVTADDYQSYLWDSPVAEATAWE